MVFSIISELTVISCLLPISSPRHPATINGPDGFKVIVVGGGPAGLVAANALHLAGVDFVVPERSKEVGEDKGGSLVLRPDSLRLRHSSTFTVDGRKTADHTGYEYLRANHSCLFVGFHRAELVGAIYDGLPNDAKAKFFTGKKVTDITSDEQSMEVTCDDGSSYTGSLVIGADDFHSKTRSLMRQLALSSQKGVDGWGPDEPYTSEYKCLWCSFPRMSPTGDACETQQAGRSITYLGGLAHGWILYERLPRRTRERACYTEEDIEAYCKTFADYPVTGELKAGLGFNNGIQDVVALCNGLYETINSAEGPSLQQPSIMLRKYQGLRQPKAQTDLALSAHTTRHPVFPDEATESRVAQVKMPESLRKEYEEYKDLEEGQPVEIPNPLYAYRFRGETEENLKVDGLDTTTRYHRTGATDLEETPQEKQDLLIETITPWTNGVRGNTQMEINLRERVVYLLQSYELFTHVCHNLWVPRGGGTGQDESTVKGRGFGSLEDVHNALHNLTGGSGSDKNGIPRIGHMTNPAVSSFDPIFWLHHTNIDRLLAIWQGPREDPDREDAWVTAQQARSGNWATPARGREDLLTPLLPFYKSTDEFWTSNEVRDTATFGYAYPETKSWNFSDPGLYRDNIREHLRTLYPSGSFANMVLASRAGDAKPEATLKERAKKLTQVEKVEAPNTALTALSLAHAAKPSIAANLQSILLPVEIPKVQIPKERSVADLVKGETYLEWLVNIKAVKHALGGRYLVHIFLGPVPPEEPTVLYAVSPYHVGTFSPFGQDEETSCGKCQEDQAARVEITGQIPLTIALAERYFAGQLPSLEEEDVKTYLQTNLHWEVVDKDGRRLRSHRDHLDGLLVGVVSNEVTLPGDVDGFPRYSEYITVYPEITTKEDGSRGRGEGTGITEENKHFC